MPERINFAALRHDARLEADNEIDGYTLSSGAFNEAVLALVEAVEAMHEWQIVPRSNAHLRRSRIRTHAALERFDFGEPS